MAVSEGSGPSGPCARAEAFYYDLLDGRSSADVPPSVIAHVQGCDYCHRRIRRLGETLSDPGVADQRKPSGEDRELIGELRSHFEYLDKPVGCPDVKPFLPSLLIRSLAIRIPTPITGHIDRCARCSLDLQALSDLKLRPEQLSRLRRLYGAAPKADVEACRRAATRIDAFASGKLERIDSEVLDHLCVCPACLGEVYQYREALQGRAGRDSRPTEGSSCPKVSMAEVFDDVVPYGRAVGESEGSEADQARREHVRSCPECLGMMQSLHRTVYDIAERADCEVMTTYSVSEGSSVLDDRPAASDETSPDGVEVLPSVPEPVVVVSGEGGAPKRGMMSRAHIRSYVKVAFFAAAMIPLAILLRLGVPTAFGLNVRKVNDAIVTAPNVHVLVYAWDRTQPSRELWFARERGVFIEKVGERQTVYDAVQAKKPTIWPEQVGLSERELTRFEGFVRHYLEFSLEGYLLRAELTLLAPERAAAPPGVDVYELAWDSSLYGGPSLPRRWWVFVDRQTKLPQRVEFYLKMTPEDVRVLALAMTEDGYVLEGSRRYEYPTEAEILDRAEALLPPK